MQKVRLNILGLSVSQTQSGAYALVLAEENGDRRIPIIIGPVEAQAIAIQLEGLKPPRPLTHDLFKNLSLAFDINISEVIIYKLEEGIFYSELVCEMGSHETRIDSRTSDAVALALRFKCPIYTTEDILSKAGIILDLESASGGEFGEEPERGHKKRESEFDRYTVSELTDMMNDAINNENYERASKIRDEINRRKK
ncbi:bifunctional nuclease family protein [Gaoshiqia sediminis]|uniref:Bifunctional nuclease family protein n=1 Tax=Gaoshiqia sediminis TaxID=2986998 RepID=A0AA41Y715_9BACT|nr:bifunctional nuclease family protein [Gaoshiqia sediminis]MCW0482651.1 bifunctional nuclease family protein [Gaoshiqia sediminis]